MSEADGPTRTVRVAPDRLPGWLHRFTERHGTLEVDHDLELVRVRAADGATATIGVPFPPLPPGDDALAAIVRHAQRDRQIGAVL